MKRLSEGNIKGWNEISKDTKELLENKKASRPIPPNTDKCGLSNPCIFGKHNKKFDKQLSI